MNLSNNLWQQDIVKICDFRYHLDDQLDVVEGHLHLTKGKSPRKGGIRNPVTNDAETSYRHLKVLTEKYAINYFNTLQKSPTKEYPYFEEVVKFKKEAKALKQCVDDIHNWFSQVQDSQAFYYRELGEKTTKLYEVAKEYKSIFKRTYPKPPIEQRPVKHIVYNERTDVRNIGFKHHSRVPVEEIVKAAKDALALSRQQKEEISKSIYRWTFNHLFPEGDRHMKAYQAFARQLLCTPVITDKFMQAFKELAPHVEMLDLEHVDFCAESLNEMSPCIGASHISPAGVYELLNAAFASPTFREIRLNKFIAKYESYNKLLKDHSFELIPGSTNRYQKKKVPETSSLPFFLKNFPSLSWK
jgi:hypothetical protein